MAVLERPPRLVLDDQPQVADENQTPRPWKWTGDDLIRMGEAGLLPPEGRFELLDGVIYELMPPKAPHDSRTDSIGSMVDPLARERGGHARQEKGIRLTDYYDPRPHIAVVRGARGTYE